MSITREDIQGKEVLASASTTDLSLSTTDLIHITGTTTISSFGVAPAGVKKNLVFDNDLIITSSADILIPDSLSISAKTNDTMEVVSEGVGVWRTIKYQRFSNAGISYSPTFTGYASTITPSYAHYTIDGKNCTVSIDMSVAVSNSTSKTVTLPFVARKIQRFILWGANSSAFTSIVGETAAGSNIMSFKLSTNATFTASGNAATYIQLTYEIQ